MRIKEKIEELETHRHPYQPGYLTTDEFLRKSDILWILDEWELVWDHKNTTGKVAVHSTSIYPGQTIAIYRRKGK